MGGEPDRCCEDGGYTDQSSSNSHQNTRESIRDPEDDTQDGVVDWASAECDCYRHDGLQVGFVTFLPLIIYHN